MKNDENILDQNLTIGPTPLLTRLMKGIKPRKILGQNINKFFRNIPSYIIIITVLLFILSVIICIIILTNGKIKEI